MQLWHNPRCSKSRQAKALLEERSVAFTERRYLEDAPSAEELTRVLGALGMEPWELARLDEAVAKELGMKAWPRERSRWIAAMVSHPQLIQRPILIGDDGEAALGRPPEAILGLL
ncbi:MAG: arsenate reductase [Deltaproteobacteria bacterium HGW-Deltaproteobacteria-14]|nr:MAG: arsenate reductase [Deltaproteobacteria bacterium HGW-Deltaproteobacteria-14]